MEEFKVGDRVYFTVRHGIGMFGNVSAINQNGTRLKIRTDNSMLYEGQSKDIIRLGGRYERSR